MLKFGHWFLIACGVGFFSALFFYEANVMWFEEGFTFGAAAILSIWGLWQARTSNLHYLYIRDNPGIGLVRLATVVAVIWCLFTLIFFGDPTIVGIWYVFYMVMAFAAIKVFGLLGAASFGMRLRIDVYERKNFAAAIYIAGFVLATGMIFGGSMWGSLTPDSLDYGGIFEIMPSYEDGWWITPWFFLMGWGLLFLTMKLWFYREKSVSGEVLRRDRTIADARAAALYCVGCAIPLTDAVAGNYYGMADSFIGFSAIALPVLAHEFIRPTSAAHERDRNEPWIYVGFGFAAMIMAPIISTLLGFR